MCIIKQKLIYKAKLRFRCRLAGIPEAKASEFCQLNYKIFEAVLELSEKIPVAIKASHKLYNKISLEQKFIENPLEDTLLKLWNESIAILQDPHEEEL